MRISITELASQFLPEQAETNNNGGQVRTETTSIAASHLGSIQLTNGSWPGHAGDRRGGENNLF